MGNPWWVNLILACAISVTALLVAFVVGVGLVETVRMVITLMRAGS